MGRWLVRTGLSLSALLWCGMYWVLVNLGERAQTPYCGPSLAHDRCVQAVRLKQRQWKAGLLQVLQGTQEAQVRIGHLRRGVVMTGGPEDEINVLRNIQQLRSLGCELPIEVWHVYEFREGFCERLRRKFGRVVCLDLTEGGSRRIVSVAQARLFAVALSHFREVLYVDADCMALEDPSPLFSSEPFQTYGAVFWRGPHDSDSVLSGSTAKANHVMWQIIDREYNASEPMHTIERGSGVLLVDKPRSREALELAVIFNSDTRFYEEVVGANGRELVRFAWLALGRPFYFTSTPMGFVDESGIGAPSVFRTFCPKSVLLFASRELLPGPGAEGDDDPTPLFIHKSPHYRGARRLEINTWDEFTVLPCTEHACDRRFTCFVALPFPLSKLAGAMPGLVPNSRLLPMHFRSHPGHAAPLTAVASLL